jgi:beta-alanine--pyruvate transaminase
MIRGVGDTLALAPPLIVSRSQIEDMVERVRRVIRAVASEHA